MKKIVPFLLSIGLAASSTAIDIPRGFFTFDKLTEAREAAASETELIGLLITDPALEPT